MFRIDLACLPWAIDPLLILSLFLPRLSHFQVVDNIRLPFFINWYIITGNDNSKTIIYCRYVLRQYSYVNLWVTLTNYLFFAIDSIDSIIFIHRVSCVVIFCVFIPKRLLLYYSFYYYCRIWSLDADTTMYREAFKHLRDRRMDDKRFANSRRLFYNNIINLIRRVMTSRSWVYIEMNNAIHNTIDLCHLKGRLFIFLNKKD